MQMPGVQLANTLSTPQTNFLVSFIKKNVLWLHLFAVAVLFSRL